MAIINVASYNFFLPSDSATTNIKAESVNDVLVLTESWHSSPIPCNINDRLWFHEVAIVQKSIYNLSATNFLTINQETVPRDFIKTLWTPMTLVSVADVVNTKGSRNQVTFLQSVTYDLVPYNLKDILSFSESLSFNIEKVLQIEDSLNLVQGTSYYKPDQVI